MEVVLLFVLIFYIVPIFLAAAAGEKRTIGRGPGYLFGILLGFIGWMIVLCFPLKDEYQAGMRKCPHCAELVKAEARVCKHCGRDLLDESAKPKVAAAPAPSLPPAPQLVAVTCSCCGHQFDGAPARKHLCPRCRTAVRA